MSQLLRLLCLLPLLVWTVPAVADDVQPVPAFSDYVVDQTGTLTTSQRQALADKLGNLERQKGSQVGVLIVQTTAPEDIFSYSVRVASSWKLGRKGVDDGVLLVVAVGDHKDNIQVGYGLEGAIPDVTSKRILQDIMSPYLHQGDFNGGINAGVDALIKLINGEPLPAARGQQGNAGFPGMIVGIVVAAFFLRAILGRALGGLAGGIAAAGIAWTLGFGLLIALGAGLFVAFILWAGQSGGTGYYGNRYGGGGYFGGGGGGFGGGSGFGGGGGGGFGGGGASGNW